MSRIKEIEERWKWLLDGYVNLGSINAGKITRYAIPDIPCLIEELKAVTEERDRYKAALERIERFNPSYEYGFENARSMAKEALGK